MKKLIFIIIPLFFLSCKKDKLTGEKEILVGKWNWVYTTYQSGFCNPPTNIEVYSPSTENKSISIEFLANGKVQFYKNDIKIELKRVVFVQWKVSTHPNFSIKPEARKFGINMNNKDRYYIEGDVSNDTLMLYPGFFPEFYSGNCDGCCYHWSYFVRE